MSENEDEDRVAPNAWLRSLDARREDRGEREPLGLVEGHSGLLLNVPDMNVPAWKALAVYHRRLGTVRTASLVGRLWLLVLS